MTIDLDFDWGEKTLMPATARGDSALREGSNRERFEDMIEAHVDRFHQDVADHIRKLLAESTSSRLVIGGAERAAHNVRDKLHETVAQNLVDILSIPMSASENDIREEVLKAGRHYEREHEQTLVDEVIGFAKAGGRGALGEDEVHRAFTMQQVELLLLPYPPQDPDVAATLTKKALDNNSEIELIHGKPAEALQQEGGVAARLYYSVNGS
jgi:peptide subunit release factor 1 (eRF1)